MLNFHKTENIKLMSHHHNKLFFILEPSGIFKAAWNIVIMILLLWTGIVTPYRLSFFTESEMKQNDLFWYMELMIDICFGVDIFFNLVTAYETKEGTMEY